MRLTIYIWFCLLVFPVITGCQSGTDDQCSLCATPTLPLVSATELDALSDNELKKKYPAGLSVDKARASAELEEKLLRLEKNGLKIINSSATPKVLRAITQEITQTGSAKAYFELVAGSDGTGFEYYINHELLPYGFRNIPNIGKKELESLSAKIIAYTFQTSHYWKNIGYHAC